LLGLAAYHFWNTADGTLSEAQAEAVRLAESGDARRVLPSEAAASSLLLAEALVDDPMVQVCASPRFDSKARLGPLARLYRVVLDAVLPSAQGYVVLASKTRGALAVWQPHGA
jgi:hypothetical protein